MLKKIWCFLVMLFAVHCAFAAPLPYSDKLGAAVSALIASKSAERMTGVALNSLPPAGMAAQVSTVTADPRYQRTLSVASFVVTGILTAAIAAGTLPFWATVALGTAASVAVPLSLNSAVEWAFDSNGVRTVSSAPAGLAELSTASYTQNTTQPVYRYGFFNYCAASVTPVPPGVPLTVYMYTTAAFYSANQMILCGEDPHAGEPGWDPVASMSASLAAKGFSVPTGSGTSLSSPVPLAQAIASLPESEKAKPLNPKIVADIANTVWKQASVQTGTIPWDETAPITPADVSGLVAGGVIAEPRVSDLVASGVNPMTGTATLPVPGAYGPAGSTVAGGNVGTVSGTQSTTTTATGTNTTINLQIDWGTFVPPALDAPPISSILDPLFNLWPDWKNFAFPAHSASCPRPSFSLPSSIVGGRTITLDSVCTWVEQVREPLQAAFAVAWSIVIVFVVMGA